MGEEMTPAELGSFLASLEGKPMLFASNVKFKEVDSVKVRDSANIPKPDTGKSDGEPWAQSFSFTATIDCDNIPSRNVRRLMGMYRPNRGSSRTLYQKLIRYHYYLNKINRKKNKQ